MKPYRFFLIFKLNFNFSTFLFFNPKNFLHKLSKLLGVVNDKSETHQDVETLLQKKFKVPRLKETHENETSRLITKCRSEISRLNEKFLRPAVF